MITLNINESKSISFDVSVQGVEFENLKGALRITHEGIEYGFPISKENDTISVVIPPLKDVIFKDINETLNAELDIIAEDTFLVPWQDTVKVEKPVTVEAKVKEVKNEAIKKKLMVDVKNISEKKTPEKENDEVKVTAKEKSRIGKRLLGD